MSSFKLVAPFFYNPEKSKQAITEGNDVELSCKLLFGFEDTNITIKWSRRTGNDNNTDQVITNKTDKYLMRSETAQQSILSIKMFAKDDAGLYICLATNSYGIANLTMQVLYRSN